MKRQGKKLDLVRRGRAEKEKIFLKAELESKARGETGAAFVRRCIRDAKLTPDIDPSCIYRVLREAKHTRTMQQAAQQQDLPLLKESQLVTVPDQSPNKGRCGEIATADSPCERFGETKQGQHGTATERKAT